MSRTNRSGRSVWLRSATLAVAALLLAGGTTLGAIRIGTDGPDTLVGTNGADTMTGKGGNDTLKGLAGNDTYYFKDGFGTDTVEERAAYKVGGKKVSGGIDALSFSKVSASHVEIYNIPQWGASYRNAYSGTDKVSFGTSVIEKVTASSNTSSYDITFTGAGANTLSPGGGATDLLHDYGGWNDGAGGHPGLAASNDTYKGLTANTGTIAVYDWGGTADVLDLRPFSTDDVYLDAINTDGDAELESLLVTIDASRGIVVVGHFGEHSNYTSDWGGQQGRVEKLLFADEMISGASVASTATLMQASGQPRPAAASERLAERVRTELEEFPEPGQQR